jgi:choline dehydrogenase-like flavoprotein
MPPFPEDREAQLLFPAARRLGWKPFHPPLAITSVEYRGRPACIRCPYCIGYLCEVEAKSSTAVTVIPQALKSGMCTLHAQAVVREITVDGRGCPNGVIYRKGNGPWKEMRAKLIIVAASAVETPRLLLNSQSRWFPTGIGNRYDQVGRNAHQDRSVAVFGYFDKVVSDGRGPGPGCALDFQFQDPNLEGGGVLYNAFSRTPLRVVNTLPRPQGMNSWGREFKEFYRKYFWQHIRVYCGAHGLPREGNRVDLDPQLTDELGMRIARVTHRAHSWSAPQLEWVAGRAEELLKEAGAQFTIYDPILPEADGPLGDHQCGTCRMGSNPRSSVTDRIGRVHDVPNLFVVGGSLMTNSGGCNPCLTIQALAYLVSEHIVRGWKGGGLNA